MTSVSSENGRLTFAMGGLAFVIALVVAACGAIAAPPASLSDPAPSTTLAVQPALTGKIDAQRRATLAKLMRTMTAAQTHNSQEVAPLGIVPTASAHSDLPQLVTYAANPDRFEVLGGAPVATKDPNYYIIADSDDAPNKGGMTAIMPGSKAYWQHAVVWNTRLTHGRSIDIVTREFAHAGLRLYVNGVLAQAGRAGFSTNAASGANFTHFDFGAVGDYEIGIELSGAIRFNGVRIAADASLSKPQRADTSTILFLGDSYTQGVVANTTTRGESLASITGRYLGGKNVITAGLSGSSVATRNGVKPAIDYYGDFVRPVIGPAIDPDMIVIAWGYNDPGSAAPTVAGLQAIWTRVRADYPRALIVVVGMWTAPLQPLRVLQNREEATRAVQGLGRSVLDLRQVRLCPWRRRQQSLDVRHGPFRRADEGRHQRLYRQPGRQPPDGRLRQWERPVVRRDENPRCGHRGHQRARRRLQSGPGDHSPLASPDEGDGRSRPGRFGGFPLSAVPDDDGRRGGADLLGPLRIPAAGSEPPGAGGARDRQSDRRRLLRLHDPRRRWRFACRPGLHHRGELTGRTRKRGRFRPAAKISRPRISPLTSPILPVHPRPARPPHNPSRHRMGNRVREPVASLVRENRFPVMVAASGRRGLTNLGKVAQKQPGQVDRLPHDTLNNPACPIPLETAGKPA